MRTYGRQYTPGDPYNSYTWVEVTTDANGNNDLVYATSLCQELQLNTNESPLHASRGIPAQTSVLSQTFPSAAVQNIQKNYSQCFASLKITPTTQTTVHGAVTPVYNIQIITHSGAILSLVIPQ